MFWQKKLEHWVDAMRARATLPLRLQLWNGRHFDFSARAPEVTIRVPTPASLTYLLNPTLDNLGRAYVEGKLEVEGHLRAIIEVANTLAEQGFAQGSRLGQLFTPRPHSRKQDASAIQYHYDVSNAFYQ
ncbi:MAG: hypothetical protein RL404_2459, partial [Pseudomonadota bacterium]